MEQGNNISTCEMGFAVDLKGFPTTGRAKEQGPISTSEMGRSKGQLRIRVVRGMNLANRDLFSQSDPYVKIKMGEQEKTTPIVNNNNDPVWNYDLTLSIPPGPLPPVKLFVYDKDITFDDKMGNAEIDIGPFLKAVNGRSGDSTSVRPNHQNCLAEESKIVWKDGKPIQSMVLGLRNVECGKVELQLKMD